MEGPAEPVGGCAVLEGWLRGIGIVVDIVGLYELQSKSKRYSEDIGKSPGASPCFECCCQNVVSGCSSNLCRKVRRSPPRWELSVWTVMTGPPTDIASIHVLAMLIPVPGLFRLYLWLFGDPDGLELQGEAIRKVYSHGNKDEDPAG